MQQLRHEVLKLMMAAGRALNADFIEIEALEIWLHYQPNDQEKSRRLADLYKDAGEVMKQGIFRHRSHPGQSASRRICR